MGFMDELKKLAKPYTEDEDDFDEFDDDVRPTRASRSSSAPAPSRAPSFDLDDTDILASSVLYELIGPGCAKLALYLSRSYSTRLEDVAAVEEVTETGERKSDVQLLIERIQKIQSELPALDNDISPPPARRPAAPEI